ncbi:VOC family protein [Flavobacterium pallidum]|uniref:VOC family protein n=1 Tax=Flavobacterium pallidum TaxID=2172098 RepID=A0A2S1SH67_9FLAO|nr:VOC family protein [Flavobacterium pallidum]AWI25721.1 VOC family protein [Flavobacterium pallidum]
MAHISAYLTFNGNCRQAMQFYRDCLGGELQLQELGDTPLGENMPPAMRHAILQATLTNSNLQLTATDMPDDDGLQRGNAVTLMLHCDTEEEIRRYYKKLSTGGRQAHPVEDVFGGGFSGDLIDKFGNRWLLVKH